MKIFNSIEIFSAYRKQLATNILANQSLGFVPTMGALHQGHISLVKQSIQENSHTVVSIFINPTQFNQSSDLNNYPQVIDKDLKLLIKAGVDAVFIPNYSDIYPDNYAFHVQENQLSNKYCGAHREGHFNGVLTVVMKLFIIIGPNKAYFGEKDFQQLTLVKQMVNAFFMPVEVIGCAIIREADGLAMSSRNLRLNKQQRKTASNLFRIINSPLSIIQMHIELTSLGFDVDYIEIMDNRLLIAAYLDEVRLIDNIQLKQIKIKEKVA